MVEVKSKQTQWIVTLSLLLVFALILGACQRAQVPETGSDSGEVTFDITDTAINGPAQASAGIVTIIGRNTSQEPRSLILVRLNPDISMEQFLETFQENPDNAIDLVTLLGGRDVAAGETNQYAIDLQEGTHVVIGFPEGEAPPLLASFDVAGEPQGSPPPADVTVNLFDFAFAIPENINPGSQTWLVENNGEQWHELVIVQLNPGVTSEDIINMMHQEQEPQGPPPWEDVAFFGPISQGERAWITLDLPAGEYTALCFLPDFSSGEAHLEKGMIQSFMVQEQ